MSVRSASANSLGLSAISSEVGACVSTAPIYALDMGTPIPWIASIILRTTLVTALSYVALWLVSDILLTYAVNVYWLRLCVIPVSMLLIPFTVKTCFEIARTSYEIEDGWLEGVDLMTVSHIRYGHHCIYLDRTVIRDVWQPKKFLDSLDAWYFENTGDGFPV